ncbi:hypothetical protein DMUE_2021 [Dictyocoela muelleri]|nr:hypothetical protein DMUE_2021 [Dictyocoela muelleri]
MAALLAFNEVFSDSSFYGCFFHFTQLLFRKIQQMGYSSEYRNNSSTREVFRMIVALAFVPFENLIIEYNKLDTYIKNKSDIHKINDFWDILKILTVNIF